MILPDGFTEYTQEWESKINAFIEMDFDRENAEGIPFAVSDDIAVKGMSLSCGSKILEKVRSPYSATAVLKLEAAGNTVIGKTNIDEFGMGSSGSSAFKRSNNPWDLGRTPGNGAAAAVAAGIAPFALASDAGGTLRQPAAFCGITGLKPTYGAVSRYGLASYASSMECIGILADSAGRCRNVFSVIAGSDPLDMSSREAAQKAAQIAAQEAPGRAKRIAALAGLEACPLDDQAGAAYRLVQEQLAALGYSIEDIGIPGLEYSAAAWHAIAAAEASANLARYDSLRYGARPAYAENPDELFDKSRGAGFGPEAKLQVLLGTHVLRSGFQEQYYIRALRIRAGIRAQFEAALHEYDAILMPVYPGAAFTGDFPAFAQKKAGLYTCCTDLAGLPALAFPVAQEGNASAGLPVGVQLTGRAFAEGALLDIAEAYQERYPAARPQGYKAFWS